MANNDLARLKRFRRVALNHDVPLPETGMLAKDEIELLREQLNASIFLEAESWMLPSWVHLTLKGLNKESSLISKLPNDSYRNWSLIGGVGAKRFGMTDSRGLSTALSDGGSLDIWVLGSEGIIFPALLGKDGPQMRLVSSEDQLYEWKTDVESVEFTRLQYYVEKDGVEYLYNEVVMKNIALEETSVTFFAAVRPLSVLGFEPIESIEFDANTNQVLANEILALHVDMAPSAVYIVDANDTAIPEVIQSDKIRYDYKSESKEGLSTAILRFNIDLSAAGTRSVVFASSLASSSDRKEIYPNSHDRDKSIGDWYDFSEKRIEAVFPDEKFNGVLAQAAVTLAIQSQSILFPDDLEDNSLNWRDRMRVLYALIKSGGIDVASKITNQAAQMFSDLDKSMDTTIFSPILWGLLQLQGYSIQKESIQENIEYLGKLTESLVSTLAVDRPRKRMLETSDREAELDDSPLEHYLVLDATLLREFNELLWDLKALQEGLSYFALTKVSLVEKIKEILPIVDARVQQKFEEIRSARWPRPNDPKMHEIDMAILDILTSIVQLKIDRFDKKFLRELCKKTVKRRVIRNLWKIQEPTELFSSHLALRIAHFHVWDQQRDAAEPLLLRALEFLSEDYLFPEFVNTRTFGGSGGAGTSVLAAADIILLLSDMLVLEDKNNLVFLAGVPSEWYSGTKPLMIKGLHTRFGKTRIEIGLSANQHQIETGMEILPDEVEIHVPETVPIRMVKAYGGSIVARAAKNQSPHLKLVPLSNDVTLTYHR
ncbi:MAG: hypothetical protein ACFFE2_07225 [Candidatus Thorarchaeota archaeon]